MRREKFGPYELLRLLALGSAWELHEAKKTRIERGVAVKILREEYAQDPSLRERIRHNISVTAQVVTPHIVPIYNWGEIDGQLYLEMTLIDGTDLNDLLARDGPLTPTASVATVGQIASVLDALHAAGLVHREVTPKKILVSRDGTAYLLGLATADQASPMYIGSYRYMAHFAPERFSSAIADGRTDVYSLACVLYECLTGLRPVPDDDIREFVEAILIASSPRPSQSQQAIPLALDEVIARGMAKEPHDRYCSAGDLARAAREALMAG